MGEWFATCIFASLPFLIRAVLEWINGARIGEALSHPAEILFFAVMVGASALIQAYKFGEAEDDTLFQGLQAGLMTMILLSAVVYGSYVNSLEAGNVADSMFTRSLIFSGGLALLIGITGAGKSKKASGRMSCGVTYLRYVSEKRLESK